MDTRPGRPALSARRARARRRSQRGAALVEALVAIPFFITVFACTMFVGKFYGDKMKTMRLSRETAWAGATKGCAGGEGAPIDDAVNADLGEAAGAPGTDVLSKGFGNSSSTLTGQVTASNVIGGFGASITSKTVVACNEQRQKNDPFSIAKYIFKFFTP
jgi:hypothetical protein